MTTTAEQCIPAIGLNAYRHEQSCHDLIILSLPARLYASQLRGSCANLCETYCCIAPRSGWLYVACLSHAQLQRRLALAVRK